MIPLHNLKEVAHALGGVIVREPDVDGEARFSLYTVTYHEPVLLNEPHDMIQGYLAALLIPIRTDRVLPFKKIFYREGGCVHA